MRMMHALGFLENENKIIVAKFAKKRQNRSKTPKMSKLSYTCYVRNHK